MADRDLFPCNRKIIESLIKMKTSKGRRRKRVDNKINLVLTIWTLKLSNLKTWHIA